MSAAALAAGGFLCGVAGCGAAAWIYNRHLTRMHESVLKKVVALSLLPAGCVLALLWTAKLALLGGGDGERLAFLTIALAGAAVCARQFHCEFARRRRMRASRVAGAPARFDAIDWRNIKPRGARILRLLAPVNRVGRLRAHHREIAIAGLPIEFDGYRIAHLTDAHIHKTLRRAWFRHAGRTAMRWNPDLVLFGGDFISKQAHAPDIAWFASQLSAPDGVAFVRGNHDFWKAPRRSVRDARASGWTLLDNRGLVLDRGGARMAVVGIESPWSPPTLGDWAAFASLPAARIGLVHTPDAFGDARRAGCAFAIAGHTHGGQIRLPLFGTVLSGCAAGPGLCDGPGRLGGMETITSRGFGAFFPLRVLCPPEIHLLTLRPAAAKGDEP